MGTKMVFLALALLLPATVAAEGDDGNEAPTLEQCPPVEVTSDPTGVALHPDCVDIVRAEESK